MGKSFEIEGKLKVIEDIQSFASGFTKREFVVEVDDGKYPQMVKFECVRDKTALTDGFAVDDPVRVTFDIRGNEYNGRYFVNLNAWKLDKAGESGAAAAATVDYSDDGPPPGVGDPPDDFAEPEDEIPF